MDGKHEHDRALREIPFFIDKEKFSTTAESLTVRQLLVDFAKEDPTQTTLVEKDGDKLIRHENLAEQIRIKPGMKFLVFHNGPTPVS